MAKKMYEIPVTFSYSGRCYIKADSLSEAIKIAGSPETRLPLDREYITDSFQVDDRRAVMEANGWEEETLDILEGLTSDEIEEELDCRYRAGVHLLCGEGRLKNLDADLLIRYLLDCCDIEYRIPLG